MRSERKAFVWLRIYNFLSPECLLDTVIIYIYGTVSSKISLMILFQVFQDKQKKVTHWNVSGGGGGGGGGPLRGLGHPPPT